MPASRKSHNGQGPRVMSLGTLSISNFAGLPRRSGKVSSANFGVVELMVLVACDKVIYQKIKWILAMDMVLAARRHLRLYPEGEENESKLVVVLETEEGDQQAHVPDISGFDKAIDDLEATLMRQLAVFSQLLRRYGLLEVLQNHYPGMPLDPILPWTQLSFTRLRRQLAEHFASRDDTLPFNVTPALPLRHRTGGQIDPGVGVWPSASATESTTMACSGTAHRTRVSSRPSSAGSAASGGATLPAGAMPGTFPGLSSTEAESNTVQPASGRTSASTLSVMVRRSAAAGGDPWPPRGQQATSPGSPSPLVHTALKPAAAAASTSMVHV
ncbi:hypothetical protein HK405_005412 [Cladochytrium tenue]|nr:hypothetical protein HK405_005412 [Cladochytrium tenue]